MAHTAYDSHKKAGCAKRPKCRSFSSCTLHMSRKREEGAHVAGSMETIGTMGIATTRMTNNLQDNMITC